MENAPQEPVLVDSPLTGAIRLTLNRPDRCNAFSSPMLTFLADFLGKLPEKADCRVLILRGNGSHFCSGLDLAEAYAAGIAGKQSAAYLMPEKVVEILSLIQKIPQTVVVSAAGGAFGGGAALLAVADFVIAADRFRIGFPELFRGLRPSLLHPFLSRKLSPSALKRLLYTPGGVGADEALRFGLVQKIVPAQDRKAETLRRVKMLLAAEPNTLVRTKKILNQTLIPPDVEIKTGLYDHWASWKTDAAQEGVAAFLEKRPPRWK